MAFLAQDQPQLALKYTQIRKPPQKDSFDIQLHSSVLLANGKVHEAFQHQRQNKVLNLQSSSVLSSFYSKAERLGKLDSILQVWFLTQFYSVDFSRSKISVEKGVFNKRTIKVCTGCF